MKNKIIDVLQTVYDPEFPLVDVWNMWLIYDINIVKKINRIEVIMTLTSPACPMADVIIEMVNTSILDIYPDWDVKIEVTFEPMWSPDLIKDDDIKRMMWADLWFEKC